MRETFPVLIFVSTLFLGAASARSQGAPSEGQLDAILQSDHSLTEKDAACAQLKRVGTKQSVPILAKLLTDPDLSHSARYALESMSTPAAGQALLEALDKTSSSNQLGVINSLAVRRQTEAVPKLSTMLSSSDATVAAAAASALGRIGGSLTVAALETASATSTGAVHDAEIDSLLICANRLLVEGEQGAALTSFRRLHDSEKNETVRMAAFRGMILASGDGGAAMATEAIAGKDASEQGAALQLVSRLSGGSATTKALCDLLGKVQAPVQIALLQCLRQRGDPSALAAVALLADCPDPNVRLAAIAAMGDLGDGSVAVLVAGKAASSSGAERDAARQALVDLRRGPVTESMISAFDSSAPPIQLELMRAFGDRADSAAALLLLKQAQCQDDSIRSAAFQALALVAGQTQVSDLVQMVVKAERDDARSEAVEALGGVCQHVEAQSGHCDVQALADAVRAGPTEARIVLLPVCAEVTESATREALRASLTDPQPQVREAAMRALCDTRDEALLPDLLNLTQIPHNKKVQTLAIRGCVRLATQEDSVKLPAKEKLRVMTQILDLPLDTEQKRVALGGLGAVADKEALVLLRPIMDDPTVQPEAAAAVLRVAHAISAQRAPEAADALRKVLTLFSVTSETWKSAQDELKALQ